MISMKLTAAEAKSETMLSYDADDAPEYPYGLTLCLCDDVLEKLGMTELPPVGTVMNLSALVTVCSVSQYENQSGKENDLSLQITDMELAAGNSEPKPIANRIYGS